MEDLILRCEQTVAEINSPCLSNSIVNGFSVKSLKCSSRTLNRLTEGYEGFYH